MAMHMQSFLNTETELGGRSDLPDEVLLALTAGGWPAIRSSTKLDTQQQQQHEVFVLEFSKEAPAALAPCGPHGSDRSSAKLIIIGTELGRSPIFAVDAPTSAATIERTLALALAAGAAVPKARWLIDLCRREPGTAPRCEVRALLSAHDGAQKLLVERGWLPATAISKGSSCAMLAQTFPEEMCPCY
ncbi:hypothetical protein Ctob_002760 [Chrysochromulina tobinii]|uniref:Uncharacterized protein n=1 Tax=Chrysochromulina tobinii TaxID=1460289 RepID=A0A0M0JAT8_9EUKA|nr:hypothetical protein Ctob_002760 [Chrysochromulina tobinii]|eukprot:KOO23600.1 hypothetical protein Ctob_002760 [Chrysochromulina sp. CCMP291]